MFAHCHVLTLPNLKNTLTHCVVNLTAVTQSLGLPLWHHFEDISKGMCVRLFRCARLSKPSCQQGEPLCTEQPYLYTSYPRLITLTHTCTQTASWMETEGGKALCFSCFCLVLPYFPSLQLIHRHWTKKNATNDKVFTSSVQRGFTQQIFISLPIRHLVLALCLRFPQRELETSFLLAVTDDEDEWRGHFEQEFGLSGVFVPHQGT